MVLTELNIGVNDNLLLKTKRAPLNGGQVRRALSLAVGRRAYVRAGHPGGAVVGAALSPPPRGTWGLPPADLADLPGHGRAAGDKARARTRLADARYRPGRRLRL